MMETPNEMNTNPLNICFWYWHDDLLTIDTMRYDYSYILSLD